MEGDVGEVVEAAHRQSPQAPDLVRAGTAKLLGQSGIEFEAILLQAADVTTADGDEGRRCLPAPGLFCRLRPWCYNTIRCPKHAGAALLSKACN